MSVLTQAPNKPSASRTVALHEIARHHSGNGKLIKGKLHAKPSDGLYPAFSASGQDVWHTEYGHEGDAIIVSAVGARCGKCFMAQGRWSAIANTHVVWPDPERVDLKYLWYLLNDEQFWIRSGSAQPFVSTKKTFEKKIPLPPLTEQCAIVAEIDKQFTRLEAGVGALKQVQASLKRYRAAVLKAACGGQLVPTEAELALKERRKFESADELILRTQAPPRPNRWNSRSNDLIHGHSALAIGKPETKLPEGWSWSALVEIAKMESGHTPSRNHPEWWDGDIAWIGIADAREHDGRTIHDTFQHTNADGIANSASRLLPKGTVCISRTASVGYVVVMGREMATSQDFVNWIPTQAVTPDWLRIIFSADRETLRRFGKGSVHKTIYFPEWLSVHIAVPPLAEQKRIVEEVERRLSVIEGLEAAVSTNLQRATRLRQSILKKTFSQNFK